MSNRLYRMGRGTLFAMLAFGGLLFFVGTMFQGRMEDLLTAYTESQTRRQAETLASQAAESLGTELKTLSYVASKIESNPDEIERMVPLLFNEHGVRQGLLTINGQTVFGEPLFRPAYNSIRTSFRGRSTISFYKEHGLLFTYPVAHGKNVKYVLYRLFPPEAIEDRFSIGCYDDVGKMLIGTRDGDVVIPFLGNDPGDISFMQSDEIKKCYQSMHREMEVSVAAARTFRTERGDMLLFEAEIPGTDYLVAGFVPKEKATEGIDNITRLVVWVFGLLMLLVGIGALYLSRVRVQLYESEELRAAKEDAEKARVEAEKAKEEAEKASQAKSEFLSTMSHEIRTPINAMLGMNEMILRECGDEEILTYSENARLAGNTLLGLVNNILDFSKIEAGKIDIIPVEYDLSAVLSDMVNMIHSRADNKGLTFRAEFDKEMPKRLYGDELRIKQIILNILTNAVKYTEKGTVTFSVGFERCPEEQDCVLLHVAVEDTGIGIKQEDLGKIYSKFARFDESRNRNVEGTGLGMTITRNLLEKMDSLLQIESTYGVGSRFSFVLRQKVIDWEPLGDYEAAYHTMLKGRKKYKEKFTAPEARVLVVDDNPLNLMVFSNLLKRTKVSIDGAASGSEGLSQARENKYDLIFLDHMMPGKDGIEVLHELRSEAGGINAETPAVCLTANAISGAREQYLEAGFNDYLTKPIDSGKLEDMLMAYLPKEKLREASGETEGGETVELVETVEIPECLAPLREQDWIDLSQGVKYNLTGENYLSVLKIFYKSMAGTAEELAGLFTEENWQNYTIKVHALKSSARLIGAEAFGEKAQLLENAGKSGDIGYILAHHREFLEEYQSFRGPLSEVFAEKEPEEGKPEAGSGKMEETFGKIRAAAEDMDDDRLEDIFKEMEAYRIPEAQEELYGKLEDAAEQLDYDAILELLAEDRQ